MALDHGQALEPIDVRPLGSAWADACSASLLKSQHLQLLRVVLRRGESLPEHHVPGEITIQCLEGLVELTAHGNRLLMRAGDMVYLQGGVPHALQAQEDTSLLVTILLERGT